MGIYCICAMGREAMAWPLVPQMLQSEPNNDCLTLSESDERTLAKRSKHWKSKLSRPSPVRKFLNLTCPHPNEFILMGESCDSIGSPLVSCSNWSNPVLELDQVNMNKLGSSSINLWHAEILRYDEGSFCCAYVGSSSITLCSIKNPS